MQKIIKIKNLLKEKLQANKIEKLKQKKDGYDIYIIIIIYYYQQIIGSFIYSLFLYALYFNINKAIPHKTKITVLIITT